MCMNDFSTLINLSIWKLIVRRKIKKKLRISRQYNRIRIEFTFVRVKKIFVSKIMTVQSAVMNYERLQLFEILGNL